MKILTKIKCLLPCGLLLVCLQILAVRAQTTTKDKRGKMNDLPVVFTGERQDLIAKQLQREAALAFQLHQLPEDPAEWKAYRKELKSKIIRSAGVIVSKDLPLNYAEKGTSKHDKFQVKNIVFQTRSGVYATANLYVPEGKGPFPAVIAMHGHWPGGKASNAELGQSLALNGYVCIALDAWGSGERTTKHGDGEYHGANLGASLLNIGESLMGVQISDNLRAVDLLCSLPYVNAERIGATGASGGGNQTMWLSALDERIKASMPVVSVGTFESYIMRHNCVCELLPDGLTFTEESGVLGMIAPRALKICNVEKEGNPTFFPSEMLRSYRNTVPVYERQLVPNKLTYQLVNQTHGYWPEIRETMLGWFDLHLKGEGTGEPKREIPFTPIPEQELLVFKNSQRPANVESLADYCIRRGKELAELSHKIPDVVKKKAELESLLKIETTTSIKAIHRYSESAGWKRVALEGSDGRVIPVIYKKPLKGNEWIIVAHPGGKKGVLQEQLDQMEKEAKGIVVVDLWGTGESSSLAADAFDKTLVSFHTLSRSSLWLGKTVQGEWIKELDLVTRFMKLEFKSPVLQLDASGECGIAALALGVLKQNLSHIVVRNIPLSYRFDEREKIDSYSMAIHIPGFINWGDVSLATALTGKAITFITPKTMSGNTISEPRLSELKQKIEQLIKTTRQPTQLNFQ